MDLSLLQNMSLAGFLTLAILLLCSLAMVALGLELRKRASSQILEGEWLLGQLRYLLFQEEVEKSLARDYLGQLDRPITRICSELLCLKKPKRKHMVDRKMMVQRLLAPAAAPNSGRIHK